MGKKKKHERKHIFQFIGIVLISIAITGLWWAKYNTAIFTKNIKEADINKNNLANPDSTFSLKKAGIGDKTLLIPEGFSITEYAKGIPSARFFTFDANNTMYVGTKDNDKVYSVRDLDGDGIAETVKSIDAGLNVPHSITYYNEDLYLAEQDKISVYKKISPDGSYLSKQTLVAELPSGNKLQGGGHTTRTIVIGPDQKMYVSIGSSCNVCVEKDSRRATIMQFDLDGKNGKVFASGLRNTVGFMFWQNQLYGADMGRDQIGNDIPPEEINVIEQNKNYGWPYCYGTQKNNPEYKDKLVYCQQSTVSPIVQMQAHSAPLGVSPLNAPALSSWPKTFQKGFFVAFHGSWNRTVPTGFKVVWVDFSQDTPRVFNFVTGWLEKNAEAWGRPVGLGFDNKGNLYISDDKQGTIYKLSY